MPPTVSRLTLVFSRHSKCLSNKPVRSGVQNFAIAIGKPIQFSTRREDNAPPRGVEDWFRQAPRGVAKDASWFTRGRLHDLREGTATLMNAALEMERLGVAVSHEALETLGRDWRAPSRYWGDSRPAEKAQVRLARLELRDQWHYLENEFARMGMGRPEDAGGYPGCEPGGDPGSGARPCVAL